MFVTYVQFSTQIGIVSTAAIPLMLNDDINVYQQHRESILLMSGNTFSLPHYTEHESTVFWHFDQFVSDGKELVFFLSIRQIMIR